MSEENKRNELPPVMLGMVSEGTPVTKRVSRETVSHANEASRPVSRPNAATKKPIAEEEVHATPSSVAFTPAANEPEDDPLAVLMEARAKLDEMFPEQAAAGSGLTPLSEYEVAELDGEEPAFDEALYAPGPDDEDSDTDFDDETAAGKGRGEVEGGAGQSDSDDDDSAKSASAKRPNVKQRRARKKIKIHPAVWVILVILAVAVVAAGGYIGWDRWLRYDDTYDIQGKWMAVGAKSAVSINEDSIKLNKEVTYAYTIDTNNKTVTLTFGKKSGLSRYRFNADRTQLAIMDCQEISPIDALMDDLSWQLSTLIPTITGGEQPSLAAGAPEAAIVLLRPDDAAAQSGSQSGTDGTESADDKKKDSDSSKSDGDSSTKKKKKKKDSEKHYETEPSTSDTGSLLDGFEVTDRPLPNSLNYTGNDWI